MAKLIEHSVHISLVHSSLRYLFSFYSNYSMTDCLPSAHINRFARWSNKALWLESKKSDQNIAIIIIMKL